MPPSDVFIAHASPDKPRAEALHAALIARGLHPFLDKPDLPPGTPWDLALAAALDETRLGAVLIGGTYNAALFLRDEVHKLIARSRAPGNALRIVPVFLDGFPTEAWRVPYGLSTFNGLSWPGEGGAEGVAARLAEVFGGVCVPASPWVPPAPTELTRRARLAACTGALPAQFEKLQYLCGAPSADLPPNLQPLTIRAVALLWWLDAQPQPDRLAFDDDLRKLRLA